MPLAVLGGSFDPVHCGHVAMARHILDAGLAREVRVIPACNSPFKTGAVVTAEDRLAMVRLAFAACSDCIVDGREIKRGGPSYMVETLEELHNEFPERKLRLIIGADNVAEFSRWHRSSDLLSLARVLVLERPGQVQNELDHLSSSFIVVSGFDQRVSSSEIRAILAAGQTPGEFVPPEVAEYIRDKSLYR